MLGPVSLSTLIALLICFNIVQRQIVIGLRFIKNFLIKFEKLASQRNFEGQCTVLFNCVDKKLFRSN